MFHSYTAMFEWLDCFKWPFTGAEKRSKEQQRLSGHSEWSWQCLPGAGAVEGQGGAGQDDNGGQRTVQISEWHDLSKSGWDWCCHPAIPAGTGNSSLDRNSPWPCVLEQELSFKNGAKSLLCLSSKRPIWMKWEWNGTPVLKYECQKSFNLHSVVVVSLFVDANNNILGKIAVTILWLLKCKFP